MESHQLRTLGNCALVPVPSVKVNGIGDDGIWEERGDLCSQSLQLSGLVLRDKVAGSMARIETLRLIEVEF